MTLPFSLGTIPLPDWLPPWVPVALLIPVVLWLLLLFAMPFAVLGTRSRLEGIEAQLDDLHAELRQVAMQLGSPLSGAPPDRPRRGPADASFRDAPIRDVPARDLPARDLSARDVVRADPDSKTSGGRAEPRINWPRGADD